MAADLRAVLRLEVPVIVRIAERTMRTSDVLALVPGSMIELPKRADDPLDLMVNNRQIGLGSAVKIGENFGIRITSIGDVRERIEAMGSPGDGAEQPAESAGEADAAAAQAEVSPGAVDAGPGR